LEVFLNAAMVAKYWAVRVVLDVFQHERLILVFDFNYGWNKFGWFAIDLNGYTYGRGKFDVFGLANAFACASQLKLSQSGRKTANDFQSTVIHRLWLVILVERVAPWVRSTAILWYIQKDETMIASTAYEFRVIFIIALKLNIIFEVFPCLFDKILAARFHILQQVKPAAGELMRIGLSSLVKFQTNMSIGSNAKIVVHNVVFELFNRVLRARALFALLFD